MAAVRDVEDFLLVYNLICYCDELSDQHIFDSTRFRAALISSEASLMEAKLVEIAFLPIRLGASLDDTVLEQLRLYREDALPLLQKMLQEDIKMPEFEKSKWTINKIISCGSRVR
jgi:hypothetical protein